MPEPQPSENLVITVTAGYREEQSGLSSPRSGTFHQKRR